MNGNPDPPVPIRPEPPQPRSPSGFFRDHLVLIAGFIIAGLIIAKGLMPDAGTGAAKSGGGGTREFTLTDLDGNRVSLASFKGNSVVILDFWATWCPPCRMTMPVLQRLKDSLGNRGLVVLSIDQGENPDKVRSFIRQNGLTMRILMDNASSVANAWGVNGIPSLFVIDKEGNVRHHEVGYEPAMETRLSEIISGLL